MSIFNIPDVTNMINRHGNKTVNQFLIRVGEKVIFQSYESFITINYKGQITLDRNLWDYSDTTLRHLQYFLMATSPKMKRRDFTAMVQRCIDNGEYATANLNK